MIRELDRVASSKQRSYGPRMNGINTGIGSFLLAAMLLGAGCEKPKPSAPAADFAKRHGCPASRVETLENTSNRMLVTGCGESELYVRRCANRTLAAPPEDKPRQPRSEEEAKFSPATSAPPDSSGCAWSREQ